MAASQDSVLTELYKYNPSALVELFELDLTPLQSYYTSKGVPITTTKYYFHNGYNQKYGLAGADVVWGGISYLARPVQIEGIQYSGAGEVARPTFTISNQDNVFTQFNKAYANLIGAKIRRIRTLVKFLDSANFSVANPTADPNAKFPDDVYVVDRMTEEVPGQITYELAPAWDVEGVQLPRRQIVANICPWVYKQDPCNWAHKGSTGVSYFSGSSVATTTIAATISGTTMTVTSASGTIRKRMFLTGGTVIAGTRIVEQLTGTTGGTGTYTISRSQTATGITAATPVGTQQDVASKSTTGSGSGIRFTITVASANASYSTATIAIRNPGNNYASGDKITIDGTYLGGVSGTNDLVVNVDQIISGQYYDANDLIVSTAAEDQCGKRLTSCKIRFGSRALPFGGFPSAGLYGKPI